jgi:hypothetical protein
MKRWSLGAVEDFELVSKHFDLARGKVCVGTAGRTRTNDASNANAEFTSEPLSLGEDIFAIRIEDDLQQTFAIAQVDENHSTMIAAAVDPASDADFLSFK